MVNLHANNLNEKYWKNPLEFNPDRFSPENIKENDIYKEVFFPFGYGGK